MPYGDFEKSRTLLSLPSTGSAAQGGNRMQEIIVIRTSDPDGSIFRSILGALQGKDVQILHATDLKPLRPDFG